LLTQPFRGEPPVDLDALADVLVGLGRLAVERPDVASVDVNPLIVRADGQPVAVDALVELGAADGKPVAVDALVELGAADGKPVAVDALVELGAAADARSAAAAPSALGDEEVLARFRPLFHPRGIIVAGA